MPNGLEKYMSFTINYKLIFINRFQFLSSSLDSLVKNLSKDDSKCLSQELDNNVVNLVRQKEEIYPYEYRVIFQSLRKNYVPNKKFIVC